MLPVIRHLAVGLLSKTNNKATTRIQNKGYQN